MANEEHFVAAIRANQEDDVPRLIYADWLEEQGDPRAEFIRLQCALAKLDSWDNGRWELEDREHS